MRSPAAPIVVLLVLLVVGPAGAAGAVAPDTAFPAQDAPDDAPDDGPNTTITIQIQPNGDARWTVTNRFAFADENESAAFEQLAADFEAGRTDTRFSTDAFESLASGASDRTEREMSIANVERSSDATNESGRLTLEFTWTSFARVDEETIRLDDVFRTESGTWLSSLSAGQRLVIEPPQGYTISSTPNGIGVNDHRIIVDGPYTGSSGEFAVEYEQGTAPGDFGVQEIGVVALLLAAMGAGGMGVYVWTRRGRSDAPADAGGPVGEPVADGHAAAPAEPAEASETEAADDDPVEDDEPVAPELLSDEERVERLIGQNGGRMMQANIVKETGWSNAKVSQLLSAMDEDGRINKLRIGRENLITLPDEDVTDLD